MSTTTQKEGAMSSAKVEVSPSGKIINNVDDGLVPISSNNNNKSKAKRSRSKKNIIDNKYVSGRKNVSDKSVDDGHNMSDASTTFKMKVDNKFFTSKKLKTIPTTTTTTTSAAIKSSYNPAEKGFISKSVVKGGVEEAGSQPVITKQLSLNESSPSPPPVAGSKVSGSKRSSTTTKSQTVMKLSSSKFKKSLSKISVSTSKGRKFSKGHHRHDRDSSSASSTNADHRTKKFKSKISKKLPTIITGEDSMIMTRKKRTKQEPAYFTISPEFFTRLKQMANEATTNGMKSSVSLSSHNNKSEESPLPPPVKMETLSKLDVLSKGNFRQLQKKSMSYQEAREALSLGHVPEANARKMKEGIMTDSTKGIASLKNSTVADSSGVGILDFVGGARAGSNNNNNKSILSHGMNISHVNIKKQLRFADPGNPTVASFSGAAASEINSSNKHRIRTVGRKTAQKKLFV